ncbi:protein of unknown function [Pseudomonas sp. JV241A]|nr:protein of unknown function [Pseudomonas sp. JV241A]
MSPRRTGRSGRRACGWRGRSGGGHAGRSRHRRLDQAPAPRRCCPASSHRARPVRPRWNAAAPSGQRFADHIARGRLSRSWPRRNQGDEKDKGHDLQSRIVPDVNRLTPKVPADRYSLGCDNNHANGGFNVAVQVHGNVVFADVTDGAVRQTNFSFGHFNAGGGQGVSDVVGADRTEQLAFVTGGGSDGHFQLGQLGSAGFSRSFFLCSQFFQLSTTLFERSQVGSGSSGGFAEWQQEVTTVTGLNIYLVAQVAQVGDFFQQDQFHLVITS